MSKAAEAAASLPAATYTDAPPPYFAPGAAPGQQVYAPPEGPPPDLAGVAITSYRAGTTRHHRNAEPDHDDARVPEGVPQAIAFVRRHPTGLGPVHHGMCHERI
ncbi:hypothetical protein BC938DRAFT_470953 [Jimgerdemannia flammicorona]|uniref:Uncharacterized protein n=1 Tax=Jimgerdemannia flammicorona TaxID=994334 RepID=A0A433QV36_9FUNG|nr:hypothetical protein BC938DRAFT_470953 [Jimgerdemannia flammicorona]